MNCEHLIDPKGIPFRILSIDPGTDTIGFAINECGLSIPHRCTVVDAFTVRATQQLLRTQRYQALENTHGHKYARLALIGDVFYRLLTTWQPGVVAYETPYINSRQPSAYGALTEVNYHMRRIVQEYDVNLPILGFSPREAKLAVGVPPKAKGKEVVKDAIYQLYNNPDKTDWDYGCDRPLDRQTEHAIDAMAVGYCAYKRCVLE